MLGYGYWQRTFGGDRAVLDRALIVNARPHQIIGVMPAGFRFDGEPDLILPLRIDRGRMMSAFRLLGVARLKPDVALAQANADAARVLDVHFEQSGARPGIRARWVPSHRLLKDDVLGDVGTTLWVLMGTIAIVLLMACANVANLLLVRAAARRQEFAVRAALGARWTRLARQLLVESLTLGVLGGALGLGLAYVGLRVLLAIEPSDLPRLTEISLDRVVLAFAVIISLASGLLFGLIPIVKFARPAARRRARPQPERQPDARGAAVSTGTGGHAGGARTGAACERRSDDPKLPGTSPRRRWFHPAGARADVHHFDPADDRCRTTSV